LRTSVPPSRTTAVASTVRMSTGARETAGIQARRRNFSLSLVHVVSRYRATGCAGIFKHKKVIYGLLLRGSGNSSEVEVATPDSSGRHRLLQRLHTWNQKLRFIIPMSTVSSPRAGSARSFTRGFDLTHPLLFPSPFLLRRRVFQRQFVDGSQAAFQLGPVAPFRDLGSCAPKFFAAWLRKTAVPQKRGVYSSAPFGDPEYVLPLSRPS